MPPKAVELAFMDYRAPHHVGRIPQPTELVESFALDTADLVGDPAIATISSTRDTGRDAESVIPVKWHTTDGSTTCPAVHAPQVRHSD